MTTLFDANKSLEIIIVHARKKYKSKNRKNFKNLREIANSEKIRAPDILDYIKDLNLRQDHQKLEQTQIDEDNQ